MKLIRNILRISSIVVVSIVGGAILVVAFLYGHDAFLGLNSPYTSRTELQNEFPGLGFEWQMHIVDNPGDWLPNGLDSADVNGDGYLDYVTNYEFRGRIRVAFHPGEMLGASNWPAVDAGRIPNAESAAFGDFDADGCPDIVVAHGIEHTDETPGIRVLWGECLLGAQAQSIELERFAWHDGGDIPDSQGGWHFLYVKTFDLDADGDQDILSGGRASRPASASRPSIDDRSLVWAGIRWFENPGGGSRDLARWQVHDIDAASRSGHGFALGDIDGDGDIDIANGNADWDTPEYEENVVWYENPGLKPEIRSPWISHEIYRGDEFYGKEQVVIVDLEGDGQMDILIQTAEAIYWFKNTGGSPPCFELEPIPKHPAAQWRARPLAAADINADGRYDLIGASIHQNGSLPQDTLALYWMEWTGTEWITHAIKWGDGFLGLGPFNGEKWDQLIPHDVDGDGDLDLVANCEEFNRLQSILAVVWFENPGLADEPGRN